MTLNKKMMTCVLVSAVAAGAALAHPDPEEFDGPRKPVSIVPVVPAATPAPMPVPLPKIRFHEMDKNGDRRISKSEWRGSARAFRKLDKNKDGVLSGVEVAVPAASAKP